MGILSREVAAEERGGSWSLWGWLRHVVLAEGDAGRTHLDAAREVALVVQEAAPRVEPAERAEPQGMEEEALPGEQTPGAFEAFFRQHERQIFRYLVRMTGEEQTAHDLTQETFLRAWLHFAKISRYDSPAAWLFRVATNLALSHRRRRATPAGSPELLGDDDRPGRSDPARQLVERSHIQQTLLELSANQRSALVLREVYGLSCDEIAGVLGISRDAAKVTLFRARERFRTRYSITGGESA
jgi:RNA polymerase sigma-70 factor, ECF subfamily